MKNRTIFFLIIVITILVSWGALVLAASNVNFVLDGQQLSGIEWINKDGHLLVPLRALTEMSGAVVTWDAQTNTVYMITMQKQAELYLKGLLIDNSATQPSIGRNLIVPAVLRQALDDDFDNDLGDYRIGHSGGDSWSNDPLVLDVRTQADYERSHIPTAIWIGDAALMGEKARVEQLRLLLTQHVWAGGKNEIVVYCYTGHQAGFVAGVLGAYGLPVKNLTYGFDVGWTGSKVSPPPLLGTVEEQATTVSPKPGGG